MAKINPIQKYGKMVSRRRLRKEFPFKFDRRHILNLNAQFITKKKKNSEQNFNFALAYSSGHKETIPIGMYKGELPPNWDIMNGSAINMLMYENAYSRQLMSAVNNFCLPDYFRIDIGYTFIKIHKKSTSEFTIGVYNVLNKKNPYLIFYQKDRWKQLSILPIIPSIQWNLSF